MIIISSRKFRDSQNEYLQKALSEEVILTTLKFGNFRLVPIIEGDDVDEESIIRKRASKKTNRKPLQGEAKEKLKEESGVQSLKEKPSISDNKNSDFWCFDEPNSNMTDKTYFFFAYIEDVDKDYQLVINGELININVIKK